MFGNILSNDGIRQCLRDRLIVIQPTPTSADLEQRLKFCHLRLRPDFVVYEEEVGKQWLKKTQHLAHGEFDFPPHGYAVVTCKERITLAPGIMGRFVVESAMIELGFGVTAGKLDPGYGEQKEQIRFGLANQLPRKNPYRSDSPLAYVEFFDLRGVRWSTPSVSGHDKKVRIARLQENANRSLDDISETDIAGTQEY